MCMHFTFVGVRYIFHAFDDFGFKRIAFLEEFADALGIRGFHTGQALQITGLPAGLGA